MVPQHKIFPALIISALFLSGCQNFTDKMLEDRPPEALYAMGEEFLKKKEYSKAAKAFDEVDRQHPYSTWAGRAQRMAGQAAYLDKNYDEAILHLQSFIQLHPSDPDIAYAQHLLGMCYYAQLGYGPRDQTAAADAQEAFQQLIQRFPNSTYAADAREKLPQILEHLASHEMVAGRYYLQAGAYGAALLRFQSVIDKYPTSAQSKEALYRLAEASLLLGVPETAQSAAQKLARLDADGTWHRKAQKLLARQTKTPR